MSHLHNVSYISYHIKSFLEEFILFIPIHHQKGSFAEQQVMQVCVVTILAQANITQTEIQLPPPEVLTVHNPLAIHQSNECVITQGLPARRHLKTPEILRCN